MKPQNIPLRTEAGKEIREGLLKGRTMIVADFSQLEMRLLAECGREEHPSVRCPICGAELTQEAHRFPCKNVRP